MSNSTPSSHLSQQAVGFDHYAIAVAKRTTYTQRTTGGLSVSDINIDNQQSRAGGKTTAVRGDPSCLGRVTYESFQLN